MPPSTSPLLLRRAIPGPGRDHYDASSPNTRPPKRSPEPQTKPVEHHRPPHPGRPPTHPISRRLIHRGALEPRLTTAPDGTACQVRDTPTGGQPLNERASPAKHLDNSLARPLPYEESTIRRDPRADADLASIPFRLISGKPWKKS
jgi:hypothetical protein